MNKSFELKIAQNVAQRTKSPVQLKSIQAYLTREFGLSWIYTCRFSTKSCNRRLNSIEVDNISEEELSTLTFASDRAERGNQATVNNTYFAVYVSSCDGCDE